MDLKPLGKRLTVVPTIAVLTLRCAQERLFTTGLNLSEGSFALVRVAAREAFTNLVEDHERVEEFNYSPDRLTQIWTAMTDQIDKALDSTSAQIFREWLDCYQQYLSVKPAPDLATKLLRLRADAAFLAELLSPSLRRELNRRTNHELVPIVTRGDVVPIEEFDRVVYSFWIDAGNPMIALDQYATFRVARKLVADTSELADEEARDQLQRLISAQS